MVDVTAKPLTRRLAVARCAVVTTVDAVAALGDAGNGMDPVEAARVAGIQAAKQTSSLVPLCHSIRVDHVAVDVEVSHAPDRDHCGHRDRRTDRAWRWRPSPPVPLPASPWSVRCSSSTRKSSMEELTLWHKSGGRSGDWQRNESGGLQVQETASPLPSKMAGLDPHQQGKI